MVRLGHGEITDDSAAEESVCPKAWGEAYKVEEPEKMVEVQRIKWREMGH